MCVCVRERERVREREISTVLHESTSDFFGKYNKK